MNSRDAQDVILRLLADGPFRAAATAKSAAVGPEVAAVLSRVDLAGLDRFGRFLVRHYYRERVVHYFKYSRALAPLTHRAPEAALKLPEFAGLMPSLVLGNRESAESVLELLRSFLAKDAEAIVAAIPYWDDLLAYQGAFFLSDALPPKRLGAGRNLPARTGVRPSGAQYPMRAETAIIIELSWDLPSVLPLLLRPFRELPIPPRKPTRLLFARSHQGEVAALRCTDALKNLLESLTGEENPADLARRMGLDPGSFDRTLRQLEQLGAVIAQESFSSSHIASDLPPM